MLAGRLWHSQALVRGTERVGCGCANSEAGRSSRGRTIGLWQDFEDVGLVPELSDLAKVTWVAELCHGGGRHPAWERVSANGVETSPD